MTTRIETYRELLQQDSDWVTYLKSNSNLPGPRGNLELAQAVADVSTRSQLDTLLAVDREHPEENTPGTFVVFCGIKGLGKYAHTDPTARQIIHSYASDPRWRIREAVAMAIQLWGELDIDSLVSELGTWSFSDALEMRAIAAGLCEPILLKNPSTAQTTLDFLDRITASFLILTPRNREDVRTLRQGLAYCWSVAVAAAPATGKPVMEKWIAHEDKDIQWIMVENLKKNRLIKMDPDWVTVQQNRLIR